MLRVQDILDSVGLNPTDSGASFPSPAHDHDALQSSDPVELLDDPESSDSSDSSDSLNPSDSLDLTAIPTQARDVALLYARGLSLSDITSSLSIDKRKILKWTHEPWWRPLVRQYFVNEDWLTDEFDRLVPAALSTKIDILTDPNVSPTLKNKVASEILDRRGYSTVSHESKPKMVPPNIKYLRMIFEGFSSGGSDR